jgi:hypothetical protein
VKTELRVQQSPAGGSSANSSSEGAAKAQSTADTFVDLGIVPEASASDERIRMVLEAKRCAKKNLHAKVEARLQLLPLHVGMLLHVLASIVVFCEESNNNLHLELGLTNLMRDLAGNLSFGPYQVLLD